MHTIDELRIQVLQLEIQLSEMKKERTYYERLAHNRMNMIKRLVKLYTKPNNRFRNVLLDEEKVYLDEA